MAARVLVTGASGFVAQHLILQLLAKGYEVRGTLRSLKRADEVKAVLSKHDPVRKTSRSLRPTYPPTPAGQRR